MRLLLFMLITGTCFTIQSQNQYTSIEQLTNAIEMEGCTKEVWTRASDSLLEDPSAMYNVLEYFYNDKQEIISFLRPSMRKDAHFLLNMRSMFELEKVLAFADPEVLNNGEFILGIAGEYGFESLQKIGKNLLDSASFIFNFIQYTYQLDILKFTSNRVKNDRPLFENLCMEYEAECLKYAGDDLFCDQSFVMSIPHLFYDKVLLERLCPKLRNDADVINAFIHQINFSTISNYIGASLKVNKSFVLSTAEYYPEILKDISEPLFQDTGFVREILTLNGGNLEYLPKEYQQNRTWVELALNDNGMAYKYIKSAALKEDPVLIRKALEYNGRTLQYMSSKWRNNREMVELALNSNPEALEYASKELKNDKPLMLATLALPGSSLEHVSNGLKKDKEVVRTAVETNGLNLKHADAALKADKEMVYAAVKKNGMALCEASEALKNDSLLAWTAVAEDPEVLSCVSNELKNNKAIVLTAVRREGKQLEHASELLRNDPDVVLSAIQQNKNAKQFAGPIVKTDAKIALLVLNEKDSLNTQVNENLLKNTAFALEALHRFPSLFSQFPSEIRNNREIVLRVVTLYPQAIDFLETDLKEDQEILLLAIAKYPQAFQLAGMALQNDKSFALEALRTNSSVFGFLPQSMREDGDIQSALKEP